MRKYLFIIICLISGYTTWGQVFDYVVDINGDGDFSNIQDAINAVSENNNERTLIFVLNGTYYEKVLISSEKTNISLIGQSVEGVKLTYDDNPGNGTSSSETYTLHAAADGFYAENITVENSSGDVGQAIAIRTTGDTMVFKNCHFIGFQDTYYAHKRRQYNLNCTVEGATDFIYGDATTVFDDCTINCVKGGSYISAPADTKLTTELVSGTFLHGLLFRYCNVTADEDVPDNSYYLGRPWQPNASSVFIKCILGDHIKPEGWSIWSDDNHLSSVFAEYQNTDSEGSLIDVSQRVEWSSQLDSTTVANLYKLSFFFRKSGKVWDPVRITKELAVPDGVELTNTTLSWNTVDDAIGYVVERNDSVIGFSTTNSLSDIALSGLSSDYKVKSVSINGTLSNNSNSIPTGIDSKKSKTGIINKIAYGNVYFSESVEYQILNVSGVLVKAGYSDKANIKTIKGGIYIVKAVNANGDLETRKIVR